MLEMFFRKIFKEDDDYSCETITPILAEIIISLSAYNDLYKTVRDISTKDYENVSKSLQNCLKNNLDGVDIQRGLNKALQGYPDLVQAICHVVQSGFGRKANPEETLIFFRLLESKARMKYREYTLKLTSIISVFFFYVFLVPTPIILASSFSPQASNIMFSLFFITSMVVFRIFFKKIGRIKGVLLG
ncbi:MAG: hypothetical protein QW797_00790 [Thermoproteota archaeon]